MKKLLFLFIISILMMQNVSAESFNGEYSIEYLLKNYNVVTLGQKEVLADNYYDNQRINKGDLFSGSSYYRCMNYTIDGAVLIANNVESNNCSTLTIGRNAGTTKSYIRGNIGSNVTIASNMVNEPNYIDFNKLYNEVVKESQTLIDNTEYYINSAKNEIEKPGIYTVQNTAILRTINETESSNNTLLIKNYDKNSIYVFNYYNEYVYINTLPNIMVMENGAPNAVYLSDYINSRNYTGNIIFNFPYAKEVHIDYNYEMFGINTHCYGQNKCEALNANIIAPNAYVYIKSYYSDYPIDFYGTIIANNVNAFNIKKTNYTLDKKIVKEKNSYIIETKDNLDDYYSRDYSIKDLLENYSLVTLGHKTISSKAKLSNLSNRNGSVRLFHITGQALINGDMVYDTMGLISAFDLQSNKVTESYINGIHAITINYSNNGPGGYTVIQPWDNMEYDNYNYLLQKNSLFIYSPEEKKYPEYPTNVQGIYTTKISNYINFDRLYNNIVTEQSGIEEGKKAKVEEDGVVHLKTGCNYTIDDINKAKEIVFDDFENNKDNITIITIKNEGDINFPLISKNGNGYKGIITNDYFGKEAATHLYEANTFVQDSYYGNIIWNVPNATYIKLKENAPFAGHLIAPNADVETPETHFAGCFIVNSIYGEGKTEAHFYPITANLKCDCEEYEELSSVGKLRYSEYKLRKLLGGEKTTIETNILGDEEQYRKDLATYEVISNKCEAREVTSPITKILKNPLTYRNIGLIIIVIGVVIGSLVLVKKRNIKQ